MKTELTSVNEQRLLDAMSKIKQALQLLESASTNLKCLPNEISTVNVAFNIIGAISQTEDLFNDLNNKITNR